MARADVLSIMYSKDRSPLDFHFDTLTAPSILNYLSVYDIQALHNIASSVRLSSKIDLKYKEIDKIMTPRGFKKFHCGTNRIVYSFLENQSFVIKIALDKVGLGDNPAEYKNQFILKPFVTKVFEVSPCGTVGMFERVQPITSRQEFYHVAEDVFELITNKIIGKYVLEDIGCEYFMNYGLRLGFGPVLLDFPYVFELDGNKLHCNKYIPEEGRLCGGDIDYDEGFNNLVCSKCGKRYLATELQQYKKDNLIIISKGDSNMKINIRKGREIVKKLYQDNEAVETSTIQKPKANGIRVCGSKQDQLNNQTENKQEQPDNQTETKQESVNTEPEKEPVQKKNTKPVKNNVTETVENTSKDTKSKTVEEPEKKTKYVKTEKKESVKEELPVGAASQANDEMIKKYEELYTDDEPTHVKVRKNKNKEN